MNYLNLGCWRMVLALCSFWLVASGANAQQTTELSNRIAQTQQQLQQTQQSIAEQRAALAKTLSELELEVASLRHKSVAVRRAKDEQSLSLKDVEQRLQAWQEQHQYQSNTLNQTLQQLGLPFNEFRQWSVRDKLNRITQEWQQKLSQRRPDWSLQTILTPAGELTEREVLQLGPVAFIAAEDGQQNGGVGYSADAGIQQVYLYEQSLQSELKQLQQQGQAALAIDPTLGKAQQTANAEKTPLAYLESGGIWVIPIIIAGLVSLLMATTKALSLYRAPAINDQAQHPMQQRLLQTIKSPQTLASKEDQLVAELQWMRFQLHKGLTVISVIATIAPLLGLLGTVTGMITTFNMMANYGTSDPQVVSGGIGQALITTELGLVVAIPSLVLSALLTRKARNDSEKLQQFAAARLQTTEPSAA